MTIEDVEQRHRDEVAAAYRASARLKLYAVWVAAFVVVVVVAAFGAMLFGWLSVSEGATWLGIAMLFALVPAANFYSDATRTTINAAGLERRLAVGEDLYTGTDQYRDKLNRLTIVGLVVALLFTGTVAIYSIANATRERSTTMTTRTNRSTTTIPTTTRTMATTRTNRTMTTEMPDMTQTLIKSVASDEES